MFNPSLPPSRHLFFKYNFNSYTHGDYMSSQVSVKIKKDVFIQLLKLKNNLKVRTLNSVLRHLIEEHELYHKLRRGSFYGF